MYNEFMPVRSALAGAASTAVVLGALGNPAAVTAARGLDHQVVADTLAGFASWDVAGEPAEVAVSVAVRLGVTVALAAVLCAPAGGARTRRAAFLGAWAAVAVGAATGGALAYAHEVATVLDGRAPEPGYVDGLVLAANAGAAFGVWTGWLVGGAVALATRTAPALAPGAAAPPARHPLADPPPPWWAPIWSASDATVRPGPTAFPPGGLADEVATGAGTLPLVPSTSTPEDGDGTPPGGPTVELATASGDPHPSDPDGAPPVGMPPLGGWAADPPDRAGPRQRDPTTPLPRTRTRRPQARRRRG